MKNVSCEIVHMLRQTAFGGDGVGVASLILMRLLLALVAMAALRAPRLIGPSLSSVFDWYIASAAASAAAAAAAERSSCRASSSLARAELAICASKFRAKSATIL